MSIVLIIAAVLAWLFGLMLIAMPATFYAPTGLTLTPMAATIAQAHGATLIGLGTANWLGRNSDRNGVVALLGGNLVVQLLSLGVVIRTMMLGAGSAVAPGVAIHVALSTLFASSLILATRRMSRDGVRTGPA